MKRVNINELAQDLKLDYDVVYNQVVSVVANEGSSDKHALIHEENQEIIVLEESDISSINDSIAENHSFIKLSNKFNLNILTMNWVLLELNRMNLLEQQAYKEYIKPSQYVDYEASLPPDEIYVGDEATITLTITSKASIEEFGIIVNSPEGLNEKYSPKIPSKLTRGEFIYRFNFGTETYGEHYVDLRIIGVVDGKYFEYRLNEALTVHSYSPEIFIEKIPRTSNVYGYFNKDIEITYRINNKGKGEAIDGVLEGFNVPELRVVSGENLGILNFNARTDHPIIVRPISSGEITLDHLQFIYKDGNGEKYNLPLDPITMVIHTRPPELKIDFTTDPSVNIDEVFPVKLKITNVGSGIAQNLSFNIIVSPEESALNVPKRSNKSAINVGQSAEWDFELKAIKDGTIDIQLSNVVYQDEEGQEFIEELPPLKIRIKDSIASTEIESDWPFQIGEKIDKYVIEEELGAGGFALVYLVEDTLLKEKRALKVLREEFINDPIKYHDFITEAKNASALFSPYIVRVFDVQEAMYNEKKYPYIIMEPVLGGSLREKMIPGQPMDLMESLYIAKDISDALLMAHQRNIIHQDIKPSNILFDENYAIWKLTDFGLAKIMKGNELLSEDGSIGYMAPEPNKTYKSDIYSLGLVFREMITGTRRGDFNILYQKNELGAERTEQLIKVFDKMTDRDASGRPELIEIVQILNLSTIRGRT